LASEVDICNLALGHFGQDASIDSIDPPDSSAEAEHCATFYPIARDELLELHPWPWATRRIALTQATNDREDWAYRYARPNLMIKPRIMLPEGYSDQELEGVPFEWEGDSLYADEADAALVYTFRQTDPTKFSPIFVTTLSFLLSSYVSGPIAKDKTGRMQSGLRNAAMVMLGKAGASTANAGSRRQPGYTPTAQRVR
jgi:hypothetical protein